MSSSSTESPEIPAALAAGPLLEPDQMLSSPMASLPLAASNDQLRHENQYSKAFAEPLILSPDIEEQSDTIVNEVRSSIENGSTANKPLSSNDQMSAQSTPEVVNEGTDQHEAELSMLTSTNTVSTDLNPLVSLVVNDAAAPSDGELTPPTFVPTEAEPGDFDMESHEPIITRSETSQTKAPVDETGAEVVKQQTLDSLDQLQQMLRAEATKVAIHQQ